MNIDKAFVDRLALIKGGRVEDIIKHLDFLVIKDSVIQNIDVTYDRLDQIRYTLWFLERNGLVILKEGYRAHIDFNYVKLESIDTELWWKKSKYISELTKDLWSDEVQITPALYRFISKDYMTDEAYLEWTKFRMALLIAIIASVLTGLFTKLFDIYL